MNIFICNLNWVGSTPIKSIAPIFIYWQQTLAQFRFNFTDIFRIYWPAHTEENLKYFLNDNQLRLRAIRP